MKTTLNTLFALLFMVGLMANHQVKAQDHANLAKKIATSKAKWLKLKKKWGNTYTYILTFSSGEGAFSTTTTVEVKKGQVVKASRTTQSFSQKNNSEVTHQKFSGAALAKFKTLDHVYAFAEKDLPKRSPKDNYITFRTFGNGLISAVGYFPKNCADDCFEGFKFKSIKAGN